MSIREWLVHPSIYGRDIFDPIEITQSRRQLISGKKSLRQIYQEWYSSITSSLPPGEKPILELGSGPGFLRDFVPDLITSDVFCLSGIDIALDGLHLPFENNSLRGIVLIDVLHHLPQVRMFFAEAIRCLQSGGVVVMHEPWVSAWSRQIYSRLHFEPFRPEASAWEFPSKGPLAGANMALPWILFERDRALFEQEFPELRINKIDPNTPFRYLLTGGVTFRNFLPAWSFTLWRGLENALNPWMRHLAMFAQISLIHTPYYDI